jgi:preprotein translocase subunit SecD
MFRFLLPGLAALVLVVAACGDGDSDEPEATLTLEADIGDAGADLSSAALLDGTAGIIRRRAELYGIEPPEVSINGNVFTINAKGIDQESAQELFGSRGVLSFRQPIVTEGGLVGCATIDGEQFAVASENVNPDDASGSLARCFSRDKLGTPIWAPAGSAVGELTSESVQPGSWDLREEPPALAARFTPAGSNVLESVTEALVGYPLGFFIDDELIAAPKISRPLVNGTALLAGFELERARVLAAVLNSGPLTAPLIDPEATGTPTAPSSPSP